MLTGVRRATRTSLTILSTTGTGTHGLHESGDVENSAARVLWYPKPSITLLVVGAIVLVAFLMRVYNLAGNPPGFFCDEASIQYDAYMLLHTGADRWGQHFPVYFRSFGDYENPLFIYTSLPFVAVMGLNPLADRLLAALYGTATVALMYPLALELFRRRDIALLATVSLAIAPWHLLFSHVAFEAISMPFFYAAATLAFLVALRRHNPRLYLISFALWGLSIYTYHVPRLLTPLLLISLLLIYYKSVWAWRRDTASGLVIYALLMIPLVQGILSGAAMARFNGIGIFAHGLHGWDLVGATLQLYIQHFSMLFLFIFGSRPGDPVLRNYIPGLGALYWAQLPLIMIGLAALLARRDRAAILVLVWLLLYPTGGALTEGPSQLRDLFGVLPFNLVTGYGAAEFWRWIRHAGVRSRPRLRSAIVGGGAAFAACVLAISLSQLWNAFYVQYPRTAAGYWGWQGGPAAIVAYYKRVEPHYDDLFVTGTFNSPEIFIPFYAPSGCERCTIGGMDRYNPARRQLFALRPDELVPGFHYIVRHTLYYGDGTVSFQIVEARRA
jgi:4-amino-4-deoxy-L-arabinose transferase-like glycosyltransferase